MFGGAWRIAEVSKGSWRGGDEVCSRFGAACFGISDDGFVIIIVVFHIRYLIFVVGLFPQIAGLGHGLNLPDIRRLFLLRAPSGAEPAVIVTVTAPALPIIDAEETILDEVVCYAGFSSKILV
jgi:hypothetical protein